MKNVFQQHTFDAGLNEDDSLSKHPSNAMRVSNNMDLMENGTNYDASNIQGNASIDTWLSTVDMGDVTCYYLGAFNVNVGTSTGDKPAILCFNKTTTGISRIQVYNLTDSVLTTLVQTDDNVDAEPLNFPIESLIDGFYYKNNNQNHFYFVDNTNVIRDVIVDETVTNTVHSITVKSYSTPDELTYVGINTGGRLKAGGYQFSFQYYNTSTKRYSAIKPFGQLIDIKPIHIFESTPPYNDVIGGYVGEITNKRIDFSITVTDTNYDAIRLLILKNTDGSKTTQETVYVTEVSTDWYDTGVIEYTGTQAETTMPLAELLIELQDTLYTGKTTTEKLSRTMVGNVKYFDFAFDNGVATFDSAYIHEEALDAQQDYKSTENAYYFTGHWRGELYRYGVSYQNEFGNWSPVQPLDFSDFYRLNPDPNRIIPVASPLSAVYTAGTLSTLLTFAGLSNAAALSVYDWITDGVNYFQVILSTTGGGNSLITVTGNATVTPYSICYGDSYNWNNGADWQFPPRSCNKHTIFDDNGDIASLGLEIRGLRNHPSWAKSVAIVRMERKKNILFQSPHVPTIYNSMGLNWDASESSSQSLNPYSDANFTQWLLPTQREFATLTPKKHLLGTARNIYTYCNDWGTIATDHFYYYGDAYYYTHGVGSATDSATFPVRTDLGVPNAICLYPPEFQMNYNGTPFSEDQLGGNCTINIVDGVLFSRKEGYATANFDANTSNYPTEYSNYIFKNSADVYPALDRTQYFYTREGNHLIGANNIFFRTIQELIPLGSEDIITYDETLGSPTNPTFTPSISNAYSIVLDSPRITLLTNPVGEGGDQKYMDSEECLYYGGLNELTTAEAEFTYIEGVTVEGNALTSNPINLTTQNQRGYVVQLSARLLDFSLPTTFNLENDNAVYFPHTSLTFPDDVFSGLPLMYDDYEFYNQYSVPIGIPSYTYPVAISDETEACCAAYVLNVESGLGSDRYGDVYNQDPFYFTGAIHELTAAEVTNNTPIDFDTIYGGDCFITRYQCKVNNTSGFPMPVQMESNSSTDNATLMVTAVHTNAVEILDFYIESSLPADLQSQVGVYPQASSGLAPYNKSWTYDYNFGYAIQNQAIPLFADQRAITTDRVRFEQRYVWSDIQVQESTIYGWNVFAPLNYRDMPDTFLGITKLIKTDNDVVWCIQQHGIKPLLIGEAQLDTQDGLMLSMKGYSTFDDNSLRWESTIIGSQHLGSIFSNGEGVFGADIQKRKVWYLPQTGGLVYISDFNEKTFFDKWFATDIIESDLTSAYNFNRNEYVIIQQGMNINSHPDVYTHKAVIWNENLNDGKGAWMTKITGNVVSELQQQLTIKGCVYAGFGFYIIGLKETFNDPDYDYSLVLEEMYAGNDRGKMLGRYLTSKFAIVPNTDSYLVKTFDVEKINSTDKINTMRMVIVNSAEFGSDQDTGELDITAYKKPPYAQYNVNRIRRNIATKPRMRGHNAVVTFTIDNLPSATNTNRKVVISDIVSQMGVSYPK